jgi:hypothetical protein
MGCIARLGCLIVLLVAGIIGYFTRGSWMPQRLRSTPAATAASTNWEPINQAGGGRTRAALAHLGEKSGPAFQTVPISDLAGFAVGELSRQLPNSVDSIATRTSGDTVYVRANVRIADLGGGSALGSLGRMLGDRETVQLGGTVHVVEPGVAELQVHSAKIRNLPIPSGMIPDLIRRLAPKRRPGSPANAIDLPVPKSLGDVRVSGGKVTLYKSGQ